MRRYGLIGFPLTHSFSARYFQEKFLREHITDASFDLFPLVDLSQFIPLLNRIPDLKGLAVTLPFKKSVMALLDHIDPEASLIGAVNCIQIFQGRMSGYNTDIIGFEQSISPLLKPHHKKALVLGTGGASMAIVFVLRKIGIDVLMVSRNANDESGTIEYGQINERLLDQYHIIVNCTPLGTHPQTEHCPDLPYNYLGEKHLCYDLVYNPADTLFLQKSAARGANIKNGLEMLEIQAEENWKIWNGNR